MLQKINNLVINAPSGKINILIQVMLSVLSALRFFSKVTAAD